MVSINVTIRGKRVYYDKCDGPIGEYFFANARLFQWLLYMSDFLVGRKYISKIIVIITIIIIIHFLLLVVVAAVVVVFILRCKTIHRAHGFLWF